MGILGEKEWCVPCQTCGKRFQSNPWHGFYRQLLPSVYDVTFRVVVARMLIENLKGEVVYIDNVFLNGDLEHEIYMKIPEGYDEVISEDVDKRIV